MRLTGKGDKNTVDRIAALYMAGFIFTSHQNAVCILNHKLGRRCRAGQNSIRRGPQYFGKKSDPPEKTLRRNFLAGGMIVILRMLQNCRHKEKITKTMRTLQKWDQPGIGKKRRQKTVQGLTHLLGQSSQVNSVQTFNLLDRRRLLNEPAIKERRNHLDHLRRFRPAKAIASKKPPFLDRREQNMPQVPETDNRQVFQQFSGRTAVIGNTDDRTGLGKQLLQTKERVVRPVISSTVAADDI